MTIRKANAAAQKPDRCRGAAAAGSTGTLSVGCGDRCVLTSASPDLHAAVDYQVDPGYVRALVAGKEQCDVRHVLRLAESAQQRPGKHLAAEGTVFQFRAGGVTFDEAR